MNSQAENIESEAVDKTAQDEKKLARFRSNAITWFTLCAFHLTLVFICISKGDLVEQGLLSFVCFYVSIVYVPVGAYSFIMNHYKYLELLAKRK